MCRDANQNLWYIFTLSFVHLDSLQHLSKIWTSTICCSLLCLKIAGRVANIVEPDETASHLVLQGLLRPVCPNTCGKHGKCGVDLMGIDTLAGEVTVSTLLKWVISGLKIDLPLPAPALSPTHTHTHTHKHTRARAVFTTDLSKAASGSGIRSYCEEDHV